MISISIALLIVEIINSYSKDIYVNRSAFQIIKMFHLLFISYVFIIM